MLWFYHMFVKPQNSRKVFTFSLIFKHFKYVILLSSEYSSIDYLVFLTSDFLYIMCLSGNNLRYELGCVCLFIFLKNIFPAWHSQTKLELWVYSFHPIWKIFGYCFCKCVFFLPPQPSFVNSNYTCTRTFNTVLQVTDAVNYVLSIIIGQIISLFFSMI